MIESVGNWVLSLHGWVALALVFALPALECSVFVGFIFPGEIAAVLGGVLAFEGRIPLQGAIIAAVLGAVIGDSIGYFVGERWGRAMLHGSIGRIIKHHHFDRAEEYMRRRGGSAVFFGRFTAALRVTVPGLAGMSKLPYGTFLFFNATGAVVWGVGFVLLGYFAGAGWHHVEAVASRIGLALLALVLLGFLATRTLSRMKAKAGGGATEADVLAAIRPVAWIRRRLPGVAAWLARRVDRSSPSGARLTLLVSVLVAVAWIAVAIAQDVSAHREIVHLDPTFLSFVEEHRTSWATYMFRGVTWLGSTAVLVPVTIVVGGAYIARRRDAGPLVWLAITLGGAIVLYEVMKPAVGRARPDSGAWLASAGGFSFPSGHATAAIAFYGMLAVLLATGRSPRVKAAIWLGAAVIVALVAASRVYLGVHWMSDVLGGLAFGAAWLCLVLTIGIAWPLAGAGTIRPWRERRKAVRASPPSGG